MTNLDQLLAAENERHKKAVQHCNRVIWNAACFMFGAVVACILILCGVAL